MRRRLVLLTLSGAALSAATGCGSAIPAVATFPGCPVPVLLSKVNRIGRKEPAPTRPTGVYDHFVDSARTERSSRSWETAHYEYTNVYLDTAERVDVYSTVTHVLAKERGTAPHVFTLDVRELVPTNADVRGSDILVDRMSVHADTAVSVDAQKTTRTDDSGAEIDRQQQTGSGSMSSTVRIAVHKVWEP